MKRLFLLALLTHFLMACNSSSSTGSSGDTASTPATTNVQNVNGNVPDTTSGMTLNKSLPVDSSRVKDSLKH